MAGATSQLRRVEAFGSRFSPSDDDVAVSSGSLVLIMPTARVPMQRRRVCHLGLDRVEMSVFVSDGEMLSRSEDEECFEVVIDK